MPSYCRLGTYHGTMLCVDATSGQIISCASAVLDSDHQAVVAFMPASSPRSCFLSAQGEPAIPVMLSPHDYRSVVLPVGVRQLDGGNRVVLYHPPTGRYLCALPPNGPGQAGELVADRPRIREWETFELIPLDQELIAPTLRAWYGTLERLLAQRLGPNAFVDFISNADAGEATAVLSAVWPLLTLAELETWAKILLGNRALLARFAALQPDNIWARASLPTLAAWNRQRESASPRPQKFRLAPALDFLAAAGSNGKFVSASHAFSAFARASIEPRRDICIISTARNEGIYTLEWLAYHLAIGVEEFFFYSNNNDDSSDELLAALADAGVITWIDNRVASGTAAQNKAYGHALGVLPDVLEYRWALIIDLDEFFAFNPVRFSSIKDFLRWHEQREVDAIAVNWKFVGSGGECVWRDAPLMRRFTKLRPEDSRTVKTMFRPRRFIHSHCHFPIEPKNSSCVFRLASGEPHLHLNPFPGLESLALAASDVGNIDSAAIYHYFYKSAEEYMWKFSRNRGDYPASSDVINYSMDVRFLQDFMEQHESTDFVLDDRIECCAPTFDAELAKLLLLPGIAAANTKIQKAFRWRMREVRWAFRSSPAVMETGELGQRFLQLAETQMPDEIDT